MERNLYEKEWGRVYSILDGNMNGCSACSHCCQKKPSKLPINLNFQSYHTTVLDEDEFYFRLQNRIDGIDIEDFSRINNKLYYEVKKQRKIIIEKVALQKEVSLDMVFWPDDNYDYNGIYGINNCLAPNQGCKIFKPLICRIFPFTLSSKEPIYPLYGCHKREDIYKKDFILIPKIAEIRTLLGLKDNEEWYQNLYRIMET